MRALVLCGDVWHPAQSARIGLGALEKRGFAFDWIEHADGWSAERMGAHPLVVLAKANNVSASDQRPWATEAVQTAFLDYVRRGNGLLVIHSGSAGYDQAPRLRRLLGGAFTHHPPQCLVTVELRAGHRLSAGSTAFTLVDEQYVINLDDDQVDIFLTTMSQHGTQPGGWTRIMAEGRVCVLTPGHNLDVWLHPSYQAVIHNALRWCGRMDPT
jgi:type 1 glutamine amidotransferase